MEKLLFIYNANSGKLNASLDTLHKVISPQTYNCNLCKITFGVFKENENWRTFRKESGLTMEFLHIDEFQKKYASKFGYKFNFPIVLATSKRGLEVFITAEELNALKNSQELVDLVRKRNEH
jgi:hypothetical protein